LSRAISNYSRQSENTIDKKDEKEHKI
jgi:hypothetical protein